VASRRSGAALVEVRSRKPRVARSWKKLGSRQHSLPQPSTGREPTIRRNARIWNNPLTNRGRSVVAESGWELRRVTPKIAARPVRLGNESRLTDESRCASSVFIPVWGKWLLSWKAFISPEVAFRLCSRSLPVGKNTGSWLAFSS
jgi:hypothetical protein